MNDVDPPESQDEESAPERPEGGTKREGPGRRLREAREAQRLTCEDAAAQLHLEARMVSALEEDDYEHMPAPIFVAGYLRSYARLLRLPEEEILEAYDQGEEAPSLLPNIDLKPQGRGIDGLMRIVTYLVILALVVLLLLWWFGVGTGRKSTLPEGNKSAPPAAASIAPSPSAPNASAADASALGGTLAPSRPRPTTPPAESTALPQVRAQTPTQRAGAGATAKSAAPKKPASGTGGASQKSAGPAGELSSMAAASAALGVSLPQHLTLHYTDDSWTEVYDAAGRRLVYRLVKAGETLELTGEAPFDVTLGYAPAVTIKYNGQPFDKGRPNSKEVAHFVVGKSGAQAGKAASQPENAPANTSAAPPDGAND